MPTYILPEHVDHLNTLPEFINVFWSRGSKARSWLVLAWDLW
jgi:hypothetical protein